VGSGNQWNVHLDETALFTIPLKTYTKALEAWYATFWVFSVQYPETLSLSCSFLEKYCIGKKISVSGVVRRLGEKVAGVKTVIKKSAGGKRASRLVTDNNLS